MKRILVLLRFNLFFVFLFFSFTAYGQIEKMGLEGSAKVNLQHPKKVSNRYLDNNGKKKKIKTKIRLIYGEGCPAYLSFESKPQQERQKAMKKYRKKLS
jgi:hypothetical protein